MWPISREAAERWAASVLRIHDTPERTASAFAIGVVLGFSPLLGLHTALGILIAFLFRLNRVAVLAGVWLNLPWFVAPYYAAATAGGALITGADIPPDLLGRIEGLWRLPDWSTRLHALKEMFVPLLVPFVLGSSIAALVLGGVAYRVALPLLLARRRHQIQSGARR